MDVPAFRKSLRVEHVPGEGAYFFSEAGPLVLTGGTAEAVTRLIDGNRSADQIATLLAGRLRGEEVYYALNVMEQSRLIYDAADHTTDNLLLWNCLGADLRQVKDSLQRVQVKVIATPGSDDAAFLQSAGHFGLRISDAGDFTVVLTDDYLHADLAEINRDALASCRPWMLVKPSGISYLLGPIFRPGITACWECLAHRLRSGRALERYFNEPGRSNSLARPLPHPQLDAPNAGHLAALHAAKWAALGTNPQLEGSIVSFSPSTLVSTSHVVTKRPQCPVCGEPGNPARLPEAPRLDNRAKVSGHRMLSAEETYGRCLHHVSPLTGIVSQITPMRAPSDDLIKLYTATHNYAMDASSLQFLKHSLETQSCGKGTTDAAARTGALLEALERYSGVFQGDEPRVRASYRALGERAIHPNDCMLFSVRQYAQRDKWNSIGSPFCLVPQPFDESAELEWSPVWSFGSRRFRFLPASYLYYGHPQDSMTASCWADSNGNAAGNSLEEAILQGFYEVVERDAVALWWYNRVNLPAVDLDSFDDPYFRRCIDFYERNGRHIWALDLTNNFEIPAFAAISRRRDQPLEEVTLGFGAHLDPHVAITRAVTEMNQFLPAVSGPIGPDGKRHYAYSDQSAIQWWQTANVSNHPYLLPSRRLRRAADYKSLASDDQLVDLMRCVLKAQRLGMDTLILDQTRPDVGVPVVKVIVPGARHFWARLAPGRLYDAPVKLGWFSRPLREEELNPVPMFL